MRGSWVTIIAVLAIAASVASFDKGQIPTECPSTNSTTVLLRHEYDCTKFYRCSRSKKILANCPMTQEKYRLYFNSDLQICDSPWKVECKNKEMNCQTAATNDLNQPHPYNCRLYYTCQNGRKIQKSCTGEDRFDHERLRCLPKTETDCITYVETCPPDGLLGTVLLPHDCIPSKYYECRGGKLMEKDCPDNENFDTSLRQCDSVVQCPPHGNVSIPHKTECSMYYRCMNGVKTEEKCEDGLSFDSVTSMCTWPPREDCSLKSNGQAEAAEASSFKRSAKLASDLSRSCQESDRFPHQCSRDQYYECINGQLVLRKCPEGFNYNDLLKSCENVASTFAYQSQKCSRVGQLLPHPYNCTLYYRCERKGRQTLLSCLQGHQFNALLEACDLPANVDCFENTPSGTDCPILDCDGVIRYRDEKDCSRYYQCENGNKVGKKCPEGLHYDPKIQMCNYPQNAGCTIGTCITGDLSEHECQCHLYYECVNGEKVVRPCPEGKNFDYIKKECVWEDRAICKPSNATDPQCIGKCSSINPWENLPHKDCHKYCQCKNGVGQAASCPKYQVYNPVSERCDWPENMKDLKCDPFPCGDQSSGSRVPHMCYCDRYYECKNGEKILVHCDKGWQFDYVLQKCILSGAHCYKNIHVNPPRGCIVNDGSSHDPSGTYPHESCNRYCSYNNGHWEIVTCREDSYYNTDIGRCDWPENIKHLGCDPFNCESRKDNATVPHECDCNIYYLCYKGSKYQKFCNEGDGFDFTLHKCVKYEDGHCYKKPSEKRPAEIEGCIGTCPSSVPNNRIRLPHEDCKKFCTCDSPNMYVNHCLKDLVYCDKLKTCTYQYRSQTCDRVRDMCASEGSFDEFPRSSVTFSEQTEEMIV